MINVKPVMDLWKRIALSARINHCIKIKSQIYAAYVGIFIILTERLVFVKIAIALA
jgi:hypothetical protein